MKNDLFSIGPFTVHGYGLMIALGLLAAYLLGDARAKRRKWDDDIVFGIAVWSAVGGVLGAKLLYILTDIKNIIADPSMLLDLSNGFVVYGGFIGGVIADVIYCRVKKVFVPQWFDVLIPSVPLAQAFGRLGCFMSGCCYGKETDGWLSITFTDSDFAPNNVALYPTQLMSSAANFIHFFLLLYVIPRFFKKPGQTFSFYLIFYSIGRFFMEMFRGDMERGEIGPFSTSQFISIFMLAGGIALLVFFTVRNYPVRDMTKVTAGDTETVAQKPEHKENAKVNAEDVQDVTAQNGPEAQTETETETEAETQTATEAQTETETQQDMAAETEIKI